MLIRFQVKDQPTSTNLRSEDADEVASAVHDRHVVEATLEHQLGNLI